MMRRLHGSKNEVTPGWWKSHNEELHNLYSSPDILSGTTSRRVKWVGLTVRIGDIKNTYKCWSENLKGKEHLGDSGVDGLNRLSTRSNSGIL
jgi:hypothetical protein